LVGKKQARRGKKATSLKEVGASSEKTAHKKERNNKAQPTFLRAQKVVKARKKESAHWSGKKKNMKEKEKLLEKGTSTSVLTIAGRKRNWVQRAESGYREKGQTMFVGRTNKKQTEA